MVWVPSPSVESENVATFRPPTTMSGAGGVCAVPSAVKVTLPVGVPLAGGVEVGGGVTVWPGEEGLGAATSMVVVAAGLTVWVRGLATTLGAKLLSPW